MTNGGTFRLKHKLLFIANALKQYHIGLAETDDGIWSIYFGTVLLAKVDRPTSYEPRNFAILPMGFCYPGTGRSGDLPPRPECAPAWRAALLSTLQQVQLTLVLGRYAQAYHLGADAGSVTELVQDWRRYWPSRLPLPHPSPRNQLWVRRNPWFATEVLPALRRRVGALL